MHRSLGQDSASNTLGILVNRAPLPILSKCAIFIGDCLGEGGGCKLSLSGYLFLLLSTVGSYLTIFTAGITIYNIQ